MKTVFSLTMYVVGLCLTVLFYPGQVYLPILGVIVLAAALGYAFFRKGKYFWTWLFLVLIVLDLLAALVLAVIAVYGAFGWIQGVLASLIVVLGVGSNIYTTFKGRMVKVKKQ